MPTPTKFYKYATIKATTAILDNGSLQWSSPTLFNDPFDMQFDLDLEYKAGRVANQVVDRFLDVYMGRVHPLPGSSLDDSATLLRACMPGLKEDVVRKENLKAIYDTLHLTARGLPKLHEKLRGTLKPRRMLCLSETHDNLLMWAHYAENHKGAVLEFSCIKEGTYESTWAAAKPVGYQVDMPRLVDEAALIRNLKGQGPLATPEQFEDTVYVKAKPWEYEKEWRVSEAGKTGQKALSTSPSSRRS